MYEIKEFTKGDIPAVLAFERELRRQEPGIYFWEPDVAYAAQLEKSAVRGSSLRSWRATTRRSGFTKAWKAPPSTTPVSGSVPDVNSAKRGSQIRLPRLVFYDCFSVVRAEGVETLDVVYLFRLDVLHEQCEHQEARRGEDGGVDRQRAPRHRRVQHEAESDGRDRLR